MARRKRRKERAPRSEPELVVTRVPRQEVYLGIRLRTSPMCVAASRFPFYFGMRTADYWVDQFMLSLWNLAEESGRVEPPSSLP